ncbi:MAG: HAMP domain-containing protein [Alphaproteobacteria bacterium]|nr:HAMP domain-containing protein [Alphaproteobacteria bacterium]
MARLTGEAEAPPAVAPARTDARAGRRWQRRREFLRSLRSPLTHRILTVNVLALALLVAGLLYLGEYQDSLIDAEVAALTTQGDIFAGAVGESAVGTGADGTQEIQPEIARPLLRRIVQATRARARLFAVDGTLVADSMALSGPGGEITIRELPPPRRRTTVIDDVIDAYRDLVTLVRFKGGLETYSEAPLQRAEQYAEVLTALGGETASAIRSGEEGGLVFSVAVPVQPFKKVLGVVLVTTGSWEIEGAVRDVRLDILKIFAIALGVTVLLSLYLAGTIARPVRRLAAAAESVRRGLGRADAIPDFTRRKDEIGDLSAALHAMTAALWTRMEAIEHFAADVAHEIKNPLSSLRSAVETAAHIGDPAQQQKLMAIILEDVQRLDRLISDISDASRLDAELARGAMRTVDVAALLRTFAEIYAVQPRLPARVVLDLPAEETLEVSGLERRLGQVIENLVTNAQSFSPPGSTITLAARRKERMIEIRVEDEGPGIPNDSLERVFERFYTQRPAGEQFGRHSGLGLSISRQIAEFHGGTIVATNRQKPAGGVAGAAFVILLPAS